MSKYTYKYTPNGKNAEKITTWLKNQRNKAESLNLLILQAERKYGNRDIVDMTTQAFLNDEINKAPISESKSLDEHLDEPNKPINDLLSENQNPETKVPEKDKVPTQSEKNTTNKKPNLGFLSNK